MFAETIINLDHVVFDYFNDFAAQSPAADFLFIVFSEYVLFLMLAVLALFFYLKKSHTRAIAIIHALSAAFIGRMVAVEILKIVFFRARPFVDSAVNLLVEKSPFESAMPSGHTTIMFAMAFSLFIYNKKWGIGFLIFALLSGIARVVVGVHFPLDILAGILVGALSAIVTHWMVKYWLSKKKKDKIV